MGSRERDGRGRMRVVGRVGSRLRPYAVAVTAQRHACRHHLIGDSRDTLVAVVLLALTVVVVGAAVLDLGVAVSNGGIAGVVLEWTVAFAFSVGLPVLAMRVASAVYAWVGR